MAECICVIAYKTDDINMLPYQLIRRIDRKWQQLRAEYEAEGKPLDYMFTATVIESVSNYFVRTDDYDQLLFLVANRGILHEHYGKILQHYTKTGKDLTENDRSLDDADD